MNDDLLSRLPPEERARVMIDRQLAASGWAVQDAARANLSASRGVAIREFVLEPPHGRVDYLCYVDGRAAGTIEAKPEGYPLISVEPQTAQYVGGRRRIFRPGVTLSRSPTSRPAPRRGLRTGSTLSLEDGGVHLSSSGDPRCLAGRMAAFTRRSDAPPAPSPDAPSGNGLLAAEGRGDHQPRGSLAEYRPRALDPDGNWFRQDPLGSVRAYRLVKFAGRQARPVPGGPGQPRPPDAEGVPGFATPDDGRKFTELYNVQHLASNVIDPSAG